MERKLEPWGNIMNVEGLWIAFNKKKKTTNNWLWYK